MQRLETDDADTKSMAEVNTNNVCLHVNIFNREHLGLGIARLQHNFIVVRPCLTRVNVIIAKGLLVASGQELVCLPDHFQNQTLRFLALSNRQQREL